MNHSKPARGFTTFGLKILYSASQCIWLGIFEKFELCMCSKPLKDNRKM